MFLQQKLRFGATLLVIGSFLAALGEILNTQTGDVLSSTWRLSLGLIVGGTLILLVGLPTFASVSNRMNGLGFFGANILMLGGFLTIIGGVALDWILIPFLINLASTIASTVNAPAIAAQNQLNKIISSLNGLGNSLLGRVLPQAVPHIAPAHIPTVNGITLVNKMLIQLHVPTLDRIEWWGHFSLSGGFLTIGCILLGLALLRRYNKLTPTSALLITLALLNLLCQFLTPIPLFFGNITAAVLLLTLGWLGISAWSAKRIEVLSAEEDEIDAAVSNDKTLMV